MNISVSDDSARWFRRIQNSRRKYFFDHLRHLNGLSGFSLFRTLGWFKDDVVYITKWSVNILLQLRAYGSIISQRYNCSYLSQFGRMMYVVFIIRLEPKYFRSYLLFLEEQWNNAGRFAFDQYEVQYQLMDRSHAEEKEILQNKLNFFKHCRTHSIPSPNVIAAFENGKLFYSNHENFRIPEADIFVKDLYGKSGQGVKRFNYSECRYSDEKGIVYSNEEIHHFLLNYSRVKHATVVQEAVSNHDLWLPFTSGSLCTCRIVTARMPNGKGIKPLFCRFRMPVGNSVADNFALGGLVSAVDRETGIMDRAISSKPVGGDFLFDSHPNTKYPLKGERLPHFDDLIECAVNAHSTFNSIFLGWDISLTNNGCYVIEGNIGWGADVVESPVNCPLTETEYPPLFEEWMKKFS